MNTSRPKPKLLASFIRAMKWGFAASKFYYAAILVAIIIVSIIPFGISYAESQVIDQIVELLNIDPEQRYLGSLATIIAAVVVLNLIQTGLWTVIAFFEKTNYFNFARYSTLQFISKASELDMYHYESPKQNDLIQKVKEIYEWRTREFLDRNVWALGNLVTIITSVLVVLSFSLPAFLLVLVTTLPSVIANIKMGKGSWGIWDANSTTKRMYWRTRDVLTRERSLMEIRIFQTAEYLIEKVRDIYDSFADKERADQRRRAIIESIVGNLSTIGTLGFWVFAILAVLNGEITLGLLTFYTSSINNFSNSLSGLFRDMSRQYESLLYLQDLFTFMDLENTIDPEGEAISNLHQPPTIEFRNVSFKYPDTDTYILRDFNLKIEPGEKVALVGANGAGKTTIIKLLCRFYDVTAGQILINGVDIRNVSLHDWYAMIGVLFQRFIAFEQFSLRENVEIGDVNHERNPQKLTDAIFKANAENLVEKYPQGLDQVLDKAFENGISPSGGEWQKIALARAFYRNSPVFILDEPTSAIDAKAEYEIFQRLYEFTKQKSVIIISHRFSTVRNADQIYVIDQGKISESGSHEQLIAQRGQYFQAFEAQAQGYR